MNIKTLYVVIAEAERFLRIAKEAKAWEAKSEFPFYGSKQTAATRRASMDLTRALAELRKW